MAHHYRNSVCALLLAVTQSTSANERPASHVDLHVQDPWLSYHDHLAEDHMECSPVAGSLWIRPTYARVLAFFDDTQLDPMVLTPGSLEPDPDITIANKSCSVKLSFSRTLAWDPLSGSAPASLSRKSPSSPRMQVPEMMAEIRYDDGNESCSTLQIPFFIDRNGITLIQSSGFELGYRISAREGVGGKLFTHTFDKPGCKITMTITLASKKNDEWKDIEFLHK